MKRETEEDKRLREQGEALLAVLKITAIVLGGLVLVEWMAGMGKLGDTFDGVMLALLYLARSAACSII